jgi:hypothetical protein
MNRTRHLNRSSRRRLAGAGAALGLAFALAGCSEAQQAIDAAQSVVNSAQAVTEACQSAAPAWEPGATVGEARASLDLASQGLSAAMAEGPGIAGADQMLGALDQALTDLEGLNADASAAAITSVVQAACSIVPQ